MWMKSKLKLKLKLKKSSKLMLRFIGVGVLIGVFQIYSPIYAFGESEEYSSASNEISFSHEIPTKYIRLILNDIEALKNWPFSNDNFYKMGERSLQSIIKTKKVSAPILFHWLTTRVHYVVEEAFSIKDSIFRGEMISYPYANIFPVEETSFQPIISRGGRKVVTMSNIGASTYRAGKNKERLQYLKWGDAGQEELIPILSPRIGIIRVGEGLFHKNDTTKKGKANPVRLISRLSTLFHEARHSDGHGESLGFFHAVCPEGHDFAGRFSCDRSTNGPYTVGAEILRFLSENCSQCSVEDKEKLRLFYLDKKSRVLVGESEGNENDWSATSERISLEF